MPVTTPPSAPRSREMCGAKLYGDQEAARISADADLREEIVRLFREQHRTTSEIYQLLQGRLGLARTAQEKTNISVVQRVVRDAVDKKTRDEILRKQRQRIYETCARAPLERERAKTMRARGLVVFTRRQLEVLLEMRPDHTANGRCDNAALAKAMNRRFRTDKFTADNCRQKAANQQYRHGKKAQAAA